jgi:heterodisulfide reductase subunit D
MPETPPPLTPSDFRAADLLAMDACSQCRICAEVCPAVAAAGDGKLSGAFRLRALQRLLRAGGGRWRRLFGLRPPGPEALKGLAETVYRCTLCGRCEEACPSGIRLRELWLALRQGLVRAGAHPAKVDRIGENIAATRNVFREDNAERADWVEGLRRAPADGHVRPRAEVVYFTGCVAAYFPMAQKIPQALAEIFEAARVDFTLLGGEEWCCGFPLLGAGLAERVAELARHNIAAVRARGAQTVVLACPSCYQMWRAHYPPAGAAVRHATQFLRDLLRAGRLPLKRLDLTVTYHDPCDLGRAAREFDAPREVIAALPGVRLVEMAHHRERCRCCGGGGNLEMIDAGLSAEIARAKIEEARATGAQAVVTACQQCVRTMATRTRRHQIPLEVLDLTQLVHRALKR